MREVRAARAADVAALDGLLPEAVAAGHRMFVAERGGALTGAVAIGDDGEARVAGIAPGGGPGGGDDGGAAEALLAMAANRAACERRALSGRDMPGDRSCVVQAQVI